MNDYGKIWQLGTLVIMPASAPSPSLPLGELQLVWSYNRHA